MSVPPELRVLCKRLVSTPTEDLPRLCPVLVGLVLQCGGPLSAVPDTKAKDKSNEAPMLVHKLRTHITTLLTGRSASGRFAAICMIKAVVDVGGWESLRASDPWIRGLISVIQKQDSFAAKELCIVTLTRIYTLLQGYQTLIREMATPTLPDYVKACLQLIKPPASGNPLKVPASFIETVACSLSRLLPIFPTTLRTFSAQVTTAFRAYVAPTSPDSAIVSHSLRESARRVLILLHYTTPKNGNSDEWLKRIRATIRDCHTTADQVFRAVQESWESTTGYRSQPVQTNADPSGGGDATEEFPPWAGLSAGSERLVGLLEFLADHLQESTKLPVAVPLGDILDITSRISLVTIPKSDDTTNLNPAISRDERFELWSVLPTIHLAALTLHTSLIRRLQLSSIPLSTDIIDQAIRILASSRHLPSIRRATYTLLHDLLPLSGPTLPKLTVSSLTSAIHSCCEDTLLPTGHLSSAPTDTPAPVSKPKTGSKPPIPASTNADAFFATPAGTEPTLSLRPRAPHEESAYQLLPLLLSHLPQGNLSPDTRALLDRTAILSRSKAAMLASCLHPYKDTRGRYYPSILPFLVRQYPCDQDVEVLRTNLVRSARLGGGGNEVVWEDPREGIDELLKEKEGSEVDDGDAAMDDDAEIAATEGDSKPKISGWGVEEETKMDVDEEVPAVRNAFFTTTSTVTESVIAPAAMDEERKMEVPLSPLKRKASDTETVKPKRVDTGKAVEVAVAEGNGGESDSDSDAESIEIDPTFDDDEEDEEEK